MVIVTSQPQAALRRIGFVVVLAAALSCGGHDEINAPRTTHLSASYVSGEAAAALSPDGQFVLKGPMPGGDMPELSSDQSRKLAIAAVRSWGPPTLLRLQQYHGAEIDIGALSPCGRVYYETAAYEPLGTGVYRPVRVAYGPKWIVFFCGRSGDPEVSVSIASYGTYLSVRGRFIISDGPAGPEFHLSGIPLGQEAPISPERAVQLVGDMSGRQVTEVPELVLPGLAVAQLGLWRLVLDAPVTTVERRTGSRWRDSVVYVGAADNYTDRRRGLIAVYRGVKADSTLPTESAIYHLDGNPRGPRVKIAVHRRAGLPRTFEPVTILPPGR